MYNVKASQRLKAAEDQLATQTVMGPPPQNISLEQNDSPRFLYNTVQPVSSSQLGFYPESKIIIWDELEDSMCFEGTGSSNLVNSNTKRRRSPNKILTQNSGSKKNESSMSFEKENQTAWVNVLDDTLAAKVPKTKPKAKAAERKESRLRKRPPRPQKPLSAQLPQPGINCRKINKVNKSREQKFFSSFDREERHNLRSVN